MIDLKVCVRCWSVSTLFSESICCIAETKAQESYSAGLLRLELALLACQRLKAGSGLFRDLVGRETTRVVNVEQKSLMHLGSNSGFITASPSCSNTLSLDYIIAVPHCSQSRSPSDVTALFPHPASRSHASQ